MNAQSLQVIVQEAFDAFVARFTQYFGRREPRERFASILRALVAPLTRKNGWQIAEAIGVSTPRSVQTFFSSQHWEPDDLRDGLQKYVVEHIGEEDAVFTGDETGFLKKGEKSAGVQRQYTGTAGGITNCQIGVFLGYATSTGSALIDRGLYIPRQWADDPGRRAEAGIPVEVAFQTKPKMLLTMVQRALENGVPARWLVADEVYGNDGKLRREIENLGLGYVLTVPKTHRFLRTCGVEAKDAAAWWPTWGWQRHSAGEGSKGPRLYDWAFRTLPCTKPGWERALMIRRSIADPEDLAYFLTFAPEGTPLEKLVSVAGARWNIETSFKEAKNEVGLDNYEVRLHTGWYRHITMSMLAFAYLAVTKNFLRNDEGIEEKKRTLKPGSGAFALDDSRSTAPNFWSRMGGAENRGKSPRMVKLATASPAKSTDIS